MDSNLRVYLHEYSYNIVISIKLHSGWGRIGKILVILLVFYIVVVAFFEFTNIYPKGVVIPSFLNPVLIALSLTFGYFALMILNLVKRRFLPTGVLLIFWGLVCFWMGTVTEEWQYVGIVLVIVGMVNIIAPLLLRRRIPAY